MEKVALLNSNKKQAVNQDVRFKIDRKYYKKPWL
jgi:hypothetical protein